jgi:transposase InsO family protein
LGKIGKLGEDLMWDEWWMRVVGQIKCNWWAYLLDHPQCPEILTNSCKMWVIQWLNKAYVQVVLRSRTWPEAMESVRRNHSPDDATTVQNISELLMSAKLGASETAASLINRVLDLNATLESLKHGFTEAQLVTVIMKALKANTHYSQTISTLKSVGGHLTLKAIQNAFNANMTPLTVPGAFHTEQAPHFPSDYEALANSVRKLTLQMKGKKQFQKTRFASPSSSDDGRRGRDGRQDRSRSPAGRYQGKSGQRGRSPVRPAIKKDTKCFNCGMNNHTVDVCRNPCGMCGARDHKAKMCKMNPKSPNYIPPFKRQNPRAPTTKAHAKVVVATTEDDEYEAGDEAQALQVMGGEIFQLHGAQLQHSQGTEEEGSGELNPVDSYLPNLAVASKASVLRPSDKPSSTWITNSGASHHFTPDRSCLLDFVPDDPSFPVRVKVANQQYATRAGVGKVVIEPCIGDEGDPRPRYILKDVWLMPTFSHGLLSTNKLIDDGNWMFSGQTPGDKNLYIVKQGTNRIWLVCKRQKSLCYPDWKILHLSAERTKDIAAAVFSGVITPATSTLSAPAPDPSLPSIPVIPDIPEPSAASANRATDKETPALWHQRLGHVRMTDLQTLVKNKSVTGIKVSPNHLGKHKSISCQTCVMAKFNRTKFKTREKTEEVMHTLHSDITGPWSTPSLGGGLYVVSLVDEASSNGAVSIIKTKSAAADEIRRLILVWEAKTQKKCRVLFTDRGGEYVGLELKEWCLNRSIMHHYSTPRVPQQNGRAERFNQTIANIMRSLMFTYKLHDSLWGHAMLYACMLYNIRMHKTQKKTRYEVFSGKVPDLSNFRTFGCKVYARVADTARNKLEPKYQLGIFLGPEQDGPGYKVLTFNDKLKRDKYQVRIFRDIICYENLTAVTGVQDEAVLHWGGHINLPQGEEINPPPPELEPLTGVPEPPADPGLQIQAPGGELPGKEGQQAELPQLEGARQPTEQPAQLTLPQQPLPLDGVPLQGAMQQKTSPTVAGINQTVVDNGKPFTQGTSVPKKQKVNPPSSVHTQVKPPVAVTDIAPVVVQNKSKESALPGKPKSTTTSTTCRVTPQIPVKRAQKKHPIVQPGHPVPVQKSKANNPIVRIVHTSTNQTGSKTTPAQTPKISPNPNLAYLRSVVTPAPIQRPKLPTVVNPPAQTTYNLRPRSVSPSGRPGPVKKPVSPLQNSVGALNSNISRTGLGFMSANSAIPLATGYTVVEPTEFTMEAPYGLPDFSAYGIDEPNTDSMVKDLLRHFGVEDKFDIPVPVIKDASKIPIPATLKQAMASPFAKDWAATTVEEWLSLVSNNIWSLVEREPWMKVIPCKWIFTVKTKHDGTLDRFKARLVAGGHRQVEGVDYNETYAPVSKHATLRTLFSVAANRGWSVCRAQPGACAARCGTNIEATKQSKL